MPYQFSVFSQRADKTLDFIRNDISSLRTGRASLQLLDVVNVEAYGTKMKVKEKTKVQWWEWRVYLNRICSAQINFYFIEPQLQLRLLLRRTKSNW